MKRKPRYLKKRKRASAIKVLLILLLALILLVAGLGIMAVNLSNGREEREIPASAASQIPVEAQSEAETETETVPAATYETEGSHEEAVDTEPETESYLLEYYSKNEDIVGWLRIPDTKLDYPLMHTPEDPEKYLHKNFQGLYSFGGLPFVDASCSMDPESDNLVIYGHNMLDGSMFRSLMKYAEKSYWEANPAVELDLMDGTRRYEIMAAFYDRVYYTYETCFKFYKFIDAIDAADFDYAVSQFKDKSLYDTGVDAQYGDKLITLVTCSYHTDNGRFVVVARYTPPEA